MASSQLISRRISPKIIEDLEQKMVQLAGPRQCGKTTLAKQLIPPGAKYKSYYNWDIDDDRKKLMTSQLDPDSPIWILDEIHKNRRWRNWLKGVYDEHHDSHQILVTGSAKLELYSRGGDSLQGRYYEHHLHPITLSELAGEPYLDAPESNLFNHPIPKRDVHQSLLLDLLKLGGFPEPLSRGSETQAKRWRLSYGTRLVQDEVRSLEQVQDLARIELLFDQLHLTVGSVLSINSLREDLEVSFNTAKKWIEIFERLYGVFRVLPYGPSRLKAVKKESKLYFWDWSRVESESSRFENLVAVHLLRWIHWMRDVLGEKYELRYFRTTVGHEVDFVVLKDRKPILAVEVKTDDRPLDAGLKYLLERIGIPNAFQISLKGEKDYVAPKVKNTAVRLCPAHRFLIQLP